MQNAGKKRLRNVGRTRTLPRVLLQHNRGNFLPCVNGETVCGCQQLCLKRLLEQVAVFILMAGCIHSLFLIGFALCTCTNVEPYICMFHITHANTACNTHQHNAALNQGALASLNYLIILILTFCTSWFYLNFPEGVSNTHLVTSHFHTSAVAVRTIARNKTRRE